ncbi:hypothetical protein HDC90_001236 [Pedobacter sp. AK013]|uniref:GIN domain-containing protein n=1 Tax=Pedobacter sp. AK013 TaxID=2723071 RepID=UPI00160DF20F|nr:DUF2807 domain-containing protein [Pedobacter sp. AK013]MBB6236624.1 hypothetical protein [Pedobacter sp. AK013]
MKTSNKLLITLAALLIIVPIIVVAINAKINYKPSKSGGFVEEQEINTEPFAKESPGRTAVPIKNPFTSINIPDARGNALQIHFIKSDVFGVKVPIEMKDAINFSVNNMGVLQIYFDDKAQPSHHHRSDITILIYCQNVSELNLTNSSELVLTAKTDSLNINMKSAGQLSFSSPITLFTSNGKSSKVINQTDIKQLNINLDSATFYSESNSYKRLNIRCKNSTVDLGGENKSNIDYLTINTLEKSEIKINKVNINKISGSLSDETTIAMPVKYLKQMLKD